MTELFENGGNLAPGNDSDKEENENGISPWSLCVKSEPQIL